MKQKLEKLKEKVKQILLEIHELSNECEGKEKSADRPGFIDPPPPDKPKHP